MTVKHFEVLVEDISGKTALEGILPRLPLSMRPTGFIHTAVSVAFQRVWSRVLIQRGEFFWINFRD
jgi:hypothetical protein